LGSGTETNSYQLSALSLNLPAKGELRAESL
jgi:hypothetical protein